MRSVARSIALAMVTTLIAGGWWAYVIYLLGNGSVP